MQENTVDEMIGRKFGKDGQLEVISLNKERYSGSRYYTLKCSVCSLDPEMFGDGIFKSPIGSLLNGQTPCGCSSAPILNKEQTSVKVKRVCAKMNYAFISFVGEWKGVATKLKLRCNLDGHEWSTATVSSFTNSGRGCPECKRVSVGSANKKPDDQIIATFYKTGSFIEGTKFWKSERTTKRGYFEYWNYSCPKCSSDEYVKAGLCSGVFEARAGGLQRGCLTCRCSTRFSWTQEQMEYRIQILLADEGGGSKFVGWHGIYTNIFSKFSVVCPKGTIYVALASNFLSKGVRCPCCAKTGYDPSKTGFVYVLRVSGSESNFTGYGISNVVRKRMATHRLKLQKGGFSIEDYSIFKTTGDSAPRIEKSIISDFVKYPQSIEGFITEATLYSNYESVVEYVAAQPDTTEILPPEDYKS